MTVNCQSLISVNQVYGQLKSRLLPMYYQFVVRLLPALVLIWKYRLQKSFDKRQTTDWR